VSEARLPDPTTRERTLAKLRQTRHQLDEYILFLDEAIAVMDAHLREQRRTRLQTRHPRQNAQPD